MANINLTVLLTGSTGFLGRQVLKILIEQSIKVKIVLRTKQYPINNVEQFITSDIFNEEQKYLEYLCKNVDIVIHIAWYTEPGEYLQSPKNIDCLIGTLALAKACVQAGVRRFIGIGTCFEYDLNHGYLSIETPLKPTTPYAASKVATFFSLSQYFATMGVEFAWCRLFYLYGEGEDKRRLLPYVKNQLVQGRVVKLTSGTQIRDYLDVQEAGRKIVKIAQSKHQGPVNICSGIPVTIRQIVERIADEYGRHDLLHFGSRPDNLVDPPCVVGVF